MDIEKRLFEEGLKIVKFYCPAICNMDVNEVGFFDKYDVAVKFEGDFWLVSVGLHAADWLYSHVCVYYCRDDMELNIKRVMMLCSKNLYKKIKYVFDKEGINGNEN